MILLFQAGENGFCLLETVIKEKGNVDLTKNIVYERIFVKARLWRCDMIIREEIEKSELENLSPYASMSVYSKGRAYPQEECDIRTVYQRDRDRIIHSKAFRRLKDKTQVFLAPQGDHYRTRLTHTLEVSQTARTIAKALLLK